MSRVDKEANREYWKRYQSKENMWRPLIFKADLSDQHAKAIKIQAAVEGATVSQVIARYIKTGLAADGRTKPAV